MAVNYDKISITLPKELNRLIDSLVEESKKTAKPITKSQFIAVACYDYLERSINVLERQKQPEKGGKA